MRTFNDITEALDLDEGELASSNLTSKPASKSQPVSFIQKENVLRRRGWGLIWDERYWEYQRPGADLMEHHDSGFWTDREPNWAELRADLREVTMWVKPVDLLPVVE